MAVPPRRIVLAIAAARRRLRLSADAVLPPEMVLFDLTMGLPVTQVTATFAELGIADVLGRDRLPTADLAIKIEADPAALHRLMRAGAACGLCTIDRRGKAKLTRLGRVLARDHPSSMRDWAIHMGYRSTSDAWADLTESVRSGASAFPRVHGMSVWQWFAEHPEEGRTFAGAMHRTTEFDSEAIAKAYDWPRGGAVCDVAGGIGALLAPILEERRDLRGVLVDGPDVLGEAERFLAARGLTDRITRVEGDMFEAIHTTADVFLLKDVLHDWDDARCARILASVAATMRPGDRLVLVELVQEPNEPHPLAPLVDLQMLTQTDGGRQRTLGELNALLRGAGLAPSAVTRTMVHSLVEAIR
ncbi:methyltransferase [Rhodococcus oryzae]|uniref:methyltransferase n=1 Tax=Rhodococcus oryzae TaxID=2571143 RepID=UPI003711D394